MLPNLESITFHSSALPTSQHVNSHCGGSTDAGCCVNHPDLYGSILFRSSSSGTAPYVQRIGDLTGAASGAVIGWMSAVVRKKNPTTRIRGIGAHGGHLTRIPFERVRRRLPASAKTGSAPMKVTLYRWHKKFSTFSKGIASVSLPRCRPARFRFSRMRGEHFKMVAIFQMPPIGRDMDRFVCLFVYLFVCLFV